jgi:hypothetical protein
MGNRWQNLSIKERFMEKIKIDPETNCWIWQASFNTTGYGQIRINKITRKAHQVAFELFIGERDKELDLCHSCNNKKCCNPEHLRQDTTSSNSIDMVKIKSHPNQILSVDEVIEIKKALRHYYYGQCRDLAHFYKVKLKTISDIKCGSSWSWLEI